MRGMEEEVRLHMFIFFSSTLHHLQLISSYSDNTRCPATPVIDPFYQTSLRYSYFHKSTSFGESVNHGCATDFRVIRSTIELHLPSSTLNGD